MRITSKGQIAIPIAIREEVGLLPGSEVEFSVEKGSVLIRKSSNPSRGSAVVERMRGTATAGLSTDEIMRLTRGR